LGGFRPEDPKSAVVLSPTKLGGSFRVTEERNRKAVLTKRLPKEAPRGWGGFPFAYLLDFPELTAPGTYRVTLTGSPAASPPFRVAADALAGGADVLLEFLRQQRCGYNPFLDAVCHPYDGRTAYGPPPAGTYVDARGGWHDAGDQLKYLLTSSTATAHLLQAWLINPSAFRDAVDALGRPGPNGIPDVLDEATWGLDWLLKLHPSADTLCHQVADDRDHKGWRLPQNDDADYGRGPGRERTVYVADGKPQGLGKYASDSTGVANLAGRYAAAMALAYRVWKDDARRGGFARDCLKAGVEVYALGKAQEGVQQGNSFGAPYRYAEETWADDMEWGAAELFRATGQASYLADAKRYARLAAATSWMGRGAAEHYQYYPFVNLGHFALHGLGGGALDADLAGWYREGLEMTVAVSAGSAFGLGVPFIWCSNNLVAALVTQGLAYERMTGDTRYRAFLADQLGWLLGRNPWGVSMFTGWPDGVPSPTQPHLPTTNLTGRSVRGGLVDGPVKAAIFRSLKGVTLTAPDAWAPFQSEEAVWHDDAMEYATNEPTMDGTAAAVLMLALATAPPPSPPPCAVRDGGLVRGPAGTKTIALVFTAHEFGEGGEIILDTLASRKLTASFFVTGDFARAPASAPLLRRIAADGHLLGPHSDRHLLYAPWTGPKKTLVTREAFRTDLDRNLEALAPFGAARQGVAVFVPPFEWWTEEIAHWSREAGFTVAGITPGTRASADYAGERDPGFVSSDAIVESVLARERMEPRGLDGFVLLMHLGSGPARSDKLAPKLGGLLDALAERGYRFARLDALLAGCAGVDAHR
ncbi:MAG TPA: glycoside hydrolase family 9 protein, partial [Thermoanaerobaculia bacterium]|nr:glycoside hydrolase family 9 protein [Thermoanaerobaculia bacterium]